MRYRVLFYKRRIILSFFSIQSFWVSPNSKKSSFFTPAHRLIYSFSFDIFLFLYFLFLYCSLFSSTFILAFFFHHTRKNIMIKNLLFWIALTVSFPYFYKIQLQKVYPEVIFSVFFYFQNFWCSIYSLEF